MDASPISDTLFHPLNQRMRRDFRGKWEASHTRTERPVKYFLIDFGSAARYDSVDPPPMEVPLPGGDRSVPEFVGYNLRLPLSKVKLHNPFPTDVYYLGNWMREKFVDVRSTRSNNISGLLTLRFPGHEDANKRWFCFAFEAYRHGVPSPSCQRHDPSGAIPTTLHGSGR